MSGYNSVFNPSQPEPSVPINGGGLSENKKFSYGFSSLRGKRASMEDFHDTKISKVDGIIVGLFGVFDGHGGSRAAVYVKQNLFKNLLEHPQFVTDTKVAIGTWRVGGVLAVSRAFGDRLLKKYVVAEPEIQDQLITSDVEFLVLASDGLWDVVSNQDAVTMVQNVQDAQEAAKRLTDEAYKKGSADNITCVVIRFHHNF
uniref:protein-serine/threonine phosphatase n=1 Tax=Physcomitrium patens TaxID=3218 RepID=A0A7I4BN82_PHYPA